MNQGDLKVPSPFGRPSSDTQNLVLSELSLLIPPQNIENKILGLRYIGARLQYIGAPKCNWLLVTHRARLFNLSLFGNKNIIILCGYDEIEGKNIYIWNACISKSKRDTALHKLCLECDKTCVLWLTAKSNNIIHFYHAFNIYLILNLMKCPSLISFFYTLLGYLLESWRCGIGILKAAPRLLK